MGIVQQKLLSFPNCQLCVSPEGAWYSRKSTDLGITQIEVYIPHYKGFLSLTSFILKLEKYCLPCSSVVMLKYKLHKVSDS